jgi:hypothetical protein
LFDKEALFWVAFYIMIVGIMGLATGSIFATVFLSLMVLGIFSFMGLIGGVTLGVLAGIGVVGVIILVVTNLK